MSVHRGLAPVQKHFINIFGEVGVMQGNGGDLQIGLPLESIHDGKNFVHDPLRLTVYIEAPEDAIERIIAKHSVVRDLVDNEWLSIVRIESTDGSLLRRTGTNRYKIFQEEAA